MGGSEITYFAYGSNMSTRRLLNRVASARSLGVGTLHAHRLAFHKVSDVDGSGKADIVAHDAGRVMGVLYGLDAKTKAELDRHEGLGTGYTERRVTVIDSKGESVVARTYHALIIDQGLKPFTWYLQHVVEGAREAGLPDDYLRALRDVDAIEDPDLIRAQRELAIYR